MNKDIRCLAVALKNELSGCIGIPEVCSPSSYDVFSCILGKIAEGEFADDKKSAEMREHIEEYHPSWVGKTRISIQLSKLKGMVKAAEESRGKQSIETLEFDFATEFTESGDSETIGVKIKVNQ